MNITQEQIEIISKKLAKLNPRNEEKLVSSMNSILSYIDLLNEIDTKNVVPTVSVIIKKNNSFKIDLEKRDINTSDLLKCSKQKIISNQIAVADIMK